MSKKDYSKYLPKDHLDNYHIEDLKSLSNEDIKPLVKDLLVWVKNMHLPVTREVVDVLITRAAILEDDLKQLLDDEKTDTVLKYNIIAYLIKSFSVADQKVYIEILTRIANKPNKYEKYSEVDIIAKEVIKNL